MVNFLSHIVLPIAIGAVTIVLLFGLFNMTARRLAQSLAEADAVARAAAVHRDRDRHAHGLGHGPLGIAARRPPEANSILKRE